MSNASSDLARSIEPLLHLLVRLSRERDGGRDPAQLQEQCCRELDELKAKAAQLELTESDLDHVRYALCALLDEVAVHNEGALKEYWQPRLLQLRYFGENVAGEAFFDRLASLRGDPKRRHVLRIYYICLLFGFRGKYRLRGSELELLEIEEGVRAELERARAIPSELMLSPSGRRPPERFADARRNQLLFTLSAIAAGAAVLLYIGMRLSLIHNTDLLIEQLASALGV